MDVTAMTMAYAKRRKKRKKRKQRRPTLGNTEDEEEGEYSSECDNDVSSSRLPWSECPTSTATATTVANRPLNPECQEFQLRPDIQTRILTTPVSTSVVTAAEEITSSINDVSDVSYIETEPSSRQTEKTCDSIVQSPTNQENATICDTEHILTETSVKVNQSTIVEHKPKNKNAEINSQANHLVVEVANETAEISDALTDEEILMKTIENNDDSISANAKNALVISNSNDVNLTDTLNNCIGYSGEGLINGETYFDHFTGPMEKKLKLASLQDNASNINSTAMEVNEKYEKEEMRHYNNPSIVRTAFVLPKKYNKKGSKFVREPTPGPDLDVENGKLIQQFEALELSDDSCAVANNKLDEINQKAANEMITLEIDGNENNKIRMTSQTIEGSNEDSGFESQTRLSEYPITAAVKEWLRRANSPDLFVTSASTSESETDEDDDDEEMDGKPPKNLQGNPMPALSANSGVDNVTLLSRTASCGEFAKTSNNNIKNNQMETDSTLISIGRRKRNAKITKRKEKAKKIEKWNRNVDEKMQSQLVSSLVSCNRLEDFIAAVRLRNTPKNNVGDVCEFTQEDSVAGMRVALSSRMNSKRVNARRLKTSRKTNKNYIENIDIKMRRKDILNDEKFKKTNEYDTVSVRTFEKGEIIVSKDGKLLPMSLYETVPSLNDQDNSSATKTASCVDLNENIKLREETQNSNENDENSSVMIASSVSIEEPDVLECWEAETIEPVITPRRMLQSQGILYEGEAAEEDNFEIERATMEHVQKYYKLEQNSVVSVEEESSEELSTSITSSRSKIVPNNSEKTIEHFCNEEIPIFIPNRNQAVFTEDEKIPVDEAFEVYESCYTGKSPFLAFDSKMFKQQSLYGQNGEGPIPCRAVCCNIQ